MKIHPWGFWTSNKALKPGSNLCAVRPLQFPDLLPTRLPFDACKGALERSGCERVDLIARSVHDAIYGIGDLVTGMADKILGKGVAKELAARPLYTVREQLGPFEDGVRNGYDCFHTIRMTEL